MNANSRRFTAAATRIAFTRKAAGPRSTSGLETDAIRHPERRLALILRPQLISRKTCDVLLFCKLKAETAAISVRSKAANLVDLRKVFRAGRDEDVSVETVAFTWDHWESKLGTSRRTPLRQPA